MHCSAAYHGNLRVLDVLTVAKKTSLNLTPQVTFILRKRHVLFIISVRILEQQQQRESNGNLHATFSRL